MKKKVKMIKQSIVLCIAVMLAGCSEDLYENENSYNSKGVKFSKVSLKDPQFLNKQLLLLEVNKLKNKNSATSLAGRMVYDSINNFYFDDENGMLVETINGYESYTFKVERQTPVDSKLENVIFSKNQEGGFDTFLAKYPYSEEQMKTLSSQAFENMETDFQMLNRAMAIICITITTYGNCNETHTNGQTCQAESVDYECFNTGGGGGGGPGGGGSPDYSGTGSNTGTGTSWEGGGANTNGDLITTPIGSGTTNNPKNPCDKVKKLKKDFVFKTKLAVLKNSASIDSFERNSVVYNDPTPNLQPGQEDAYDYVDSLGTANTPEVGYAGYSTMQGVIHSHYQGLISIFSPKDLQDMYNQMVYPDITDDFFIGLVTAEGTAYILQVIDRDAFIAFGNTHLSNDKKFENFKEKIYYKKYNISTNNSKQENEKNFLIMMDELDAGISLAGTTYDPNTTTPAQTLFSNLQVKTISDMTQNVQNTNCN